MLFRFLTHFLFAWSVSGCIAAGVDGAILERASTNTLSVAQEGRTKIIELEVSIADWRVSCNRRYAIVWGQTTRRLPDGVPPYAVIYVVDVERASVRESFTTTRGPFEVQFDEAGLLGIVDEYVVNLPSGEIRFTEVPPDLNFRAESCPDFPGRRPSHLY